MVSASFLDLLTFQLNLQGTLGKGDKWGKATRTPFHQLSAGGCHIPLVLAKVRLSLFEGPDVCCTLRCALTRPHRSESSKDNPSSPEETKEERGSQSLTMHLKDSWQNLFNMHTFPFCASQQLSKAHFTDEKVEFQNDSAAGLPPCS